VRSVKESASNSADKTPFGKGEMDGGRRRSRLSSSRGAPARTVDLAQTGQNGAALAR
jgi:hypothetical protein